MNSVKRGAVVNRNHYSVVDQFRLARFSGNDALAGWTRDMLDCADAQWFCHYWRGTAARAGKRKESAECRHAMRHG